MSIRELNREILVADNVLAVAKLCEKQKENKKTNLQDEINVSDNLKFLSGGENNLVGMLDLVENLLTVDTDEEGSAILVPILKVLSKELEEIDEANELFVYWKLSRQWCQQLLDVRSATTCVVSSLLSMAMEDDFLGTAKNLYTTAFFLMQCHVSVHTVFCCNRFYFFNMTLILTQPLSRINRMIVLHLI